MRGGAPSARTSANEAKKSRIDSTVEKTSRKTGRTGWTDGETVVVGSETGRDTARRRLRPSSHIEHLVTRVVGRRRRLRRIGRAADGETSRQLLPCNGLYTMVDVTRLGGQVIGGAHLLLIFSPPRGGFSGCLLPSAKEVVLGRPLMFFYKQKNSPVLIRGPITFLADTLLSIKKSLSPLHLSSGHLDV